MAIYFFCLRSLAYHERMPGGPDQADIVRCISALDDPSRRGLFDFVRSSGRPVTREAAAEALGMSRKLAAFHLDKLVDVGLLAAEYDTSARSRTLGRSPKTYRPSGRAIRLSIPARRPEALAELLLEAVTAARAGESTAEAALRLAYEDGRELGKAIRAEAKLGRLGPERALGVAAAVLTDRGFEPAREGGCVTLHNCPYLPMSAHATELVCGINHRQLSGLLDGMQAPTSMRAVLAPRPGRCCVELRTAAAVSDELAR
jgi:predicted ArsR family transcriptional regulator